jgi:hypothetical protein
MTVPSDFDFAAAEAWETSTDTLLPVGSHVVKVVSASMGDTKTGKPQIELKVESTSGAIRDWLVITPKSIGKIAALYDASGTNRPQAEEVNPHTGVIADEAVGRLLGKTVGVVVYDDTDGLTGKTQRRVRGYVRPDQITGHSAEAMSDLGEVKAAFGEGVTLADDDIPF